MTKTFLFSLMTLFSTSAFATNDWVILTEEQQEIVAVDICAAAAIDESASLVAEEILDAGVDFPDHIFLFDLYVSEKGKFYVVTFQDDSSITVQTKRKNSKCTAKASRVTPQ